MKLPRVQQELADLTHAAAEQYPGATLSVAVCRPDGRPLASVAPNTPHEALSLGKLVIVRASYLRGVSPTIPILLESNDRSEGGPLAHFTNRGVMITARQAIAEALVVSGNTGTKALTRISGGPGDVNKTLGKDFAVTGLRTVEGSKNFSNWAQPYTHGLTTAAEAALLFAQLTSENSSAKKLLAQSNDTFGLRRYTDHMWGDSLRPAGTEHPANTLMRQLDELVAVSAPNQSLFVPLQQILSPNWKPGDVPAKAGIDDDPDISISARHDVAQIGGLIVATLTSYPYGPEHRTFDLGTDHPGHIFQAHVGQLVLGA